MKNVVMKKLLCLISLVCVLVGTQAQTSRNSSFRVGSLSDYGLSDGSRKTTTRPQSRQTTPYQQSRSAVNNNSFSMANSSYTAPKTETVRYEDGSAFRGRTLNGMPIDGVVEGPDGTKIHCGFENGRISGLCLTEHTDGSWYVGMWKDGERHGEGTCYLTTNKYLEMEYDEGALISVKPTNSPKYTKEGYLGLQQKRTQILQDGLNEINYNSSPTQNGSSRRSTSSNSRACGVCAGSGKCNTCNGKGYYTAIGIGSGKHSCPNCGQTGRCRSCNGTGRR